MLSRSFYFKVLILQRQELENKKKQREEKEHKRKQSLLQKNLKEAEKLQWDIEHTPEVEMKEKQSAITTLFYGEKNLTFTWEVSNQVPLTTLQYDAQEIKKFGEENCYFEWKL